MTYFKLEGHIRFENFISKLKKYLGMTSRLVKNQQGFSSHLFGRALVTIVFMLIGWLPSLAHDFEVDGIFYNKTSGNTATVTYEGDTWNSNYNEYSGNVVIPSSIDYNGTTYSVTSIGDDAFKYCISLTSIEIPNSVTSIGDYAFSGCSNLTSIEIPNSVTSIGGLAFSGCTSLTSVVIGNSVTSIGDWAFRNCDSLTSIEIPNSVTSIGDHAFYYCSSLTSIEIPNSVTSIGDSAFYGCESLTSIEIPNSVTSIGEWAFSGCTSLISIVIGDSVTSIGDYAFNYCTSLTSIEIPNSVTSIGEEAFYNCSGLASIEIPNSVTSIGDSAFSWCTSLTSIQIPGSVTSIGDYAFQYCSSLTCIVIPNSVTSIGDEAFDGCYNLTKITCLATTPPMIDSNTFSNYSAELYVPAGCKSAYQSANYWNYFNIKEIPTLSTSIALTQTIITLKASETITLIATILPENATDKSVEWSSSNESVATIDANGLVTAIAVGEAIITATTADGSNLSATCKVIVVPTLATSIILDKTEYEIVEKSDFQLTATILPESTTNNGVVWSSSDMWIASVDENGLVRAYSVGEAVITATTIDGSNLSASCKVTVISSLAQSITLDKTEVSLEVTETAALVATVLPETTSNKSVEWKSSNEAVATVNNKGEVTAIAVGEATITVTTVDGSNLSVSCTVTVVPTLAETITLDKIEISLEATETATLIATVLPELTTDKSVEWSSSDETVAVVDKNGVVTAVAVGEAIITATTADGSNLSATCKVTVIPTLAVSIELDQTEASVEEKSDLQLMAIILPEHATNKEVAWSSSDKWVATVDNTGLVTIHSAGEVIITATTTDGTNLSATCRINVYSGIDGVNGDVIVATIGDNIVVKNAQLGSNVRVYAADGSIITSEIATDGDVVIEAPVKGIYIVAIDGKSFKVMVK